MALADYATSNFSTLGNSSNGGFSGSPADAFLGTVIGTAGSIIGGMKQQKAQKKMQGLLTPIWQRDVAGLKTGKYNDLIKDPMKFYMSSGVPSKEITDMIKDARNRRIRTSVLRTPGHSRRPSTFIQSPTHAMWKSPRRAVGLWGE